jgi:hypothetical protein
MTVFLLNYFSDGIFYVKVIIAAVTAVDML